MMSAIAEAFNIMRDGLGMELDEIADVYEKWNKEGELVWTARPMHILNADERL